MALELGVYRCVCRIAVSKSTSLVQASPSGWRVYGAEVSLLLSPAGDALGAARQRAFGSEARLPYWSRPRCRPRT